MRKASGHPIPLIIGDRRPGDLAVCYSKVAKAKQELNWEATRNVDEMCQGSTNLFFYYLSIFIFSNFFFHIIL